MPRRLFAVTAMILAVAALVPLKNAHAAGGKPVLAYYFPWYESSDWASGKMSDLPSQPYNGGDGAVLAEHIQQARRVGVPAFICSWFGPDEARLTDRCNRLLDAAGTADFSVTISPDQAADFTGKLRTPDGMANALTYLRDHWLAKPQWQRIDGRPVVLFWNPQSYGSVDAWRALQARVDPGHAWYWIGEGVDFSYLDVFDANYYFDITWAANPGDALNSYGNRLTAYNRAHGSHHPFVATVMPGYNDIAVRNGRVRDRANGDYYRRSWQAAIDHNPGMVIITSWNEWYEGTQIEPGRSYGNLYLDITRDSAANFQSIGAPSAGPGRTFPATGQTTSGRLLQYWDANGALPVFGFPIGPQSQQATPDGTFALQWFERNRLELHPENAAPYDVLLGRLGADALARQGRPWQSLGREAPRAGCRFFADTGHNLCEPFSTYWKSNGLDLGDPGVSERESLALFGQPISAVMNERNSSGDVVPTQWFERARFEYHAANRAPYNVLLGRLGAELRP
ncbi:MAG: hypothetical protein NVSMB42_22310 [Herpetosiphon sp.]